MVLKPLSLDILIVEIRENGPKNGYLAPFYHKYATDKNRRILTYFLGTYL